MQANIGSDAERIQAIQELERAIQSKMPDLVSAQSQVASARKLEFDRRQKIGEFDRQIRRVGNQVHRTGRGVYLNGQTLDRGNLMLGNLSLRFRGWHGNVEIDLRHITSIDIGTSHLPSRAGTPFIEMLMPGDIRPQQTLLITVQEAKMTSPQLAVIAAIDDGQAWLVALQTQREKLGNVRAERDDLGFQRETAKLDWDDANRRLQEAQSALTLVQSEIRQLQMQQQKLRDQQRQVDRTRAEAAKEAGRKK